MPQCRRGSPTMVTVSPGPVARRERDMQWRASWNVDVTPFTNAMPVPGGMWLNHTQYEVPPRRVCEKPEGLFLNNSVAHLWPQGDLFSHRPASSNKLCVKYRGENIQVNHGDPLNSIFFCKLIDRHQVEGAPQTNSGWTGDSFFLRKFTSSKP